MSTVNPKSYFRRESDLARLRCHQKSENASKPLGPAWAVDDSKMQLYTDQKHLGAFGFPPQEVDKISSFSDAYSKINKPSEPPPSICILDCDIPAPLEKEEAEKELLAQCKQELIEKGALKKQDADQLPEGPVLLALMHDKFPETPIILTSEVSGIDPNDVDRKTQKLSTFAESQDSNFIPKGSLGPTTIRAVLDKHLAARTMKQQAPSTVSHSAPSTHSMQKASPFQLPAHEEPKPLHQDEASSQPARTPCCNKLSNFFKAVWETLVPPTSPKPEKTI